MLNAAGGRLCLVKARFGKLDQVAQARGLADFDGVVLDIGVSSMQIDDAARGFSFRADGPLDMRMDCEGRAPPISSIRPAKTALADIFYYFGEERASRRIARAIVVDRAKAPFTTTARARRDDRPRRAGKARRRSIRRRARFQALRIAVNDELGELVRALAAAEAVLKQGGRLAVVTFHSLEDRIVKQFFAERSGRGQAPSRRLPGETAPPEPTFVVAGKQPIMPSRSEIAANPRARSAKLRHGVRTEAPPRGLDERLMALREASANRDPRGALTWCGY